MSRRSSPTDFLAALGVPAEPGSLSELALTHRSFAFESGGGEHNERLEFLGDAILGAIVTDLIYRDHPKLAEGEMARLRASVVNTGALAQMARSIGLGAHIRLGKGEESSGGRGKASLLADTFEALIGAAYLERGMDAVAEILVPLFGETLEGVIAAGGGHDPKTALQELVVRSRSARPSYKIASSGPDHDKRFVAHVLIDGELHGSGSGRSKKEAEQQAARAALVRLEGAPVEGLAAEAAAAAACLEEGTDARAS
ncbi:MAG: ribonuclease III [Actinomycetota bacterium]